MSLQQWLGEVAARLGLDLGLRARSQRAPRLRLGLAQRVEPVWQLMKLVTRDLLTGIKISKAKMGRFHTCLKLPNKKYPWQQHTKYKAHCFKQK